MFRSKKSIGILVALSLGLLAGCEDLSKALGPTPTTPTTPTTATLTLWTSDPAPSYIAVQVDGAAVGTLTAYRLTPPTCGSTSAGSITVTVAAGMHTIAAYETSASGYWSPSQVTVDGGKCLTYEFRQ